MGIFMEKIRRWIKGITAGRLSQYLAFIGIGLAIGLALNAVFSLPKPQAKPPVASDIQEAAIKTYVPPGQLDQYYMFASGGQGGDIRVYGLPSMRMLRTIPVFAPDPAYGYGFDKATKEMLGEFTWGDLHHPALSETNGEFDGRWLFVNDVANNRAARINLKTFETEQILGPIPNVMGPHCAAFVTPNTEYFFMPTRFSAPIPTGTYQPIEKYKEEYKGVMAAIKIHSETGEMSLAWEVILPPWQYEMSDSGKKISDGWCFLTDFNSEEAYQNLEVEASQRDRDYLVLINWRAAEKAVEEGHYQVMDGAKMIDPTQVPGLVYLIPAAKSPHGIDVSPDGKYLAVAGKLAPVVTVFNFEKILEAIKNQDFQGEERGFPVLNYEAVKETEVPVGLGPLHTTYDDQGYAYTSLFVESAVVKWQLGTWEVVDKIHTEFNIGHLAAVEGETTTPKGKFLVVGNKISKSTFLPVGPAHPVNLQLIDISGPKMKIIYNAPGDPEPHNIPIIGADKIKPLEVYPKELARPNSVWQEVHARVERQGDQVTVYMVGTRNRYKPEIIEVNQGDKVVFHITNIDVDENIAHGIAFCLYNHNVGVQPGETVSFELVTDKPGVYPFYCTDFCSALHEEMQGWMLVKPKS